MKIVREQLNEIKQNISGSGLSAIGIGAPAVIKKIKDWFKNNQYYNNTNFIIDDNLNVILKDQTDYLYLRKKVPNFIKFKFIPTSSMFNIAIAIKDNEILNNLLEDYKKLNIIFPLKYKNFIDDMENLNYVCISTRVQFKHDAVVFIDLIKHKIIYVRFFNKYVTIRRGEVLDYPWHRVCQKLVRHIINVNIDDYSPIKNYLAYYRSKY